MDSKNPAFPHDLPPGATPNDGHPLTVGDAGQIARATLDKRDRETTHAGIECARVVSVTNVDGNFPHATVDVVGGGTIMVPVLTNQLLYPGLTVALLWDNPHGCYVIGSPTIASVPIGRISLRCTGGGGGGG